jgi:hypothetical protein
MDKATSRSKCRQHTSLNQNQSTNHWIASDGRGARALKQTMVALPQKQSLALKLCLGTKSNIMQKVKF